MTAIKLATPHNNDTAMLSLAQFAQVIE